RSEINTANPIRVACNHQQAHEPPLHRADSLFRLNLSAKNNNLLRAVFTYDRGLDHTNIVPGQSVPLKVMQLRIKRDAFPSLAEDRDISMSRRLANPLEDQV